MSPVTMRDMVKDDVANVVRTHIDAFPSFFLTFLGAPFLRELYCAILEDPTGIVRVAVQPDQRLAGFAAGTVEPSGMYRRWLKQRWWRFAFAAARPFLSHPRILPRLVRAFTMPRQTSGSPGDANLMSLAVSPQNQGMGVGQRLVVDFLEECRRRGARRVSLTADAAENERVNMFYNQCGLRLEKSFVTPEKRVMNEYVVEL